MKKSINLWSLVGFAVTSFLGTILHFLYDWLGKASIVAPFSSVNESTWEHMKLLYWPMFIFAIVQGIYFTKRNDFWCVKLKSMLLGLCLIPFLFYTYNGAIGKSPDWINIVIFFVSAGISYLYEARQFQKEDPSCKYPKISIFLLSLIGSLFIIFTFFPIKLPIFQDPISGAYGI